MRSSGWEAVEDAADLFDDVDLGVGGGSGVIGELFVGEEREPAAAPAAAEVVAHFADRDAEEPAFEHGGIAQLGDGGDGGDEDVLDDVVELGVGAQHCGGPCRARSARSGRTGGLRRTSRCCARLRPTWRRSRTRGSARGRFAGRRCGSKAEWRPVVGAGSASGVARTECGALQRECTEATELCTNGPCSWTPPICEPARLKAGPSPVRQAGDPIICA